MLLVGCGPGDQESATTGRLTVCASDGYLDLVRTEADKFMELYQNASVHAFSASTREAIVALLNDSVPFIVTDRVLNEEERSVAESADLSLQELKIAVDALVILVNKENSLTSISMEDLTRIVTGEWTDWSQLPASQLTGPIQFVSTGPNSGAFELIERDLLPEEKDLTPQAVVATQEAVREYVAGRAGAIGLISVASYRTPSSHPDSTAVHLLSVIAPDSTGQMVEYGPHQAYIYLGTYPLHYPVFSIFNYGRSELAAGFSGFIASAPGQKLILNSGLVPATMPVRLVEIKKESP
jgi:phosphate transport system substrate-binding protein